MNSIEILENLKVLKEAYKRAAESGGVTTYTLNSGQGTTNVKQASLKELREEIQHYENLYNEAKAVEDGSCFTLVRGLGLWV